MEDELEGRAAAMGRRVRRNRRRLAGELDRDLELLGEAAWYSLVNCMMSDQSFGGRAGPWLQQVELLGEGRCACCSACWCPTFCAIRAGQLACASPVSLLLPICQRAQAPERAAVLLFPMLCSPCCAGQRLSRMV